MKTFFTRGIKLAIITAVISGFAVFFNKFAVTKNINPYQFTALKNVLVAVVLSLMVMTPFIFKKFKDISRKNWIRLIGIGVIGGSIPFLLFFKGLSMTSAVNAGFLHKTLFIWVTILAVIFLKEKITKMQYVALGVLFIGNILVGGLTSFKFGYAEMIILMATLLWSIENIIAKKVLREIDPKIVAWSRMFFGSIILLIFIMFTSGIEGIFSLDMTQWGWILLSVGFLTAYVITWYHALKFEKASTVVSILVIASPITTLLNTFYKGSILDVKRVIGMLISLLAIVVFIYFGSKISKASEKQDVSAV